MTTQSPSEQPFRFLGRQLDATGWVEDTQADRLTKLTAIGYGDPAFAAFYPSCHSVFGCFDADVDDESKLVGLSYQVLGWYSDPTVDPLVQVMSQLPGASQATVEAAFREQLAWDMDLGPLSLPTGITCYADLTFAPNTNIANSQKNVTASVSVGNTGTEALAAFLSTELPTHDPFRLQEQLANLLLESQLQDKELDLGPRFRAARHAQGFKAISSGNLWEIQPVEEAEKNAPSQIILPPELADELDQLNQAQKAVDKAKELVIQQKHLLFTDWYKYMLCAYPPDDSRDDYPDIDFVRWFIENNTLPAVAAAQTDLAQKELALPGLKTSLETQLADFNQSTFSHTLGFKKLDHDTANLSGITVNNAVWEKNEPFSDHCLAMNGTDAYMVMIGVPQPKAISLWVNVANENPTSATLLANESIGRLISKSGIPDVWSKVAINGKALPLNQIFTWESLPKDQWFHLYLEFEEAPFGDSLYMFGFGSSRHCKGKIAGFRIMSRALTPDELYSDLNMLGHRNYALKEVPGPRFWEPTEPVVLMAGDAMEPTFRHGQDGRLSADQTLECRPILTSSYPLREIDFSELVTQVTNSRPAAGTEKIGYDTWRELPWNPFLLDWEVELQPLEAGGNLNIDSRKFAPDFINQNFELQENHPDLNVKSGKQVVNAATTFRGRSILTRYAKKVMTETLVRELEALQPENCYQAITVPELQVEKDFYQSELAAWFNEKPETPKGILTLLASTTPNIIGWKVEWEENQGVVQALNTGATTTLEVANESGSLIETFTISGTAVTNQLGTLLDDPDAVVLLSQLGTYVNYQSWYLNKPVYNNRIQGILSGFGTEQAGLVGWWITWEDQQGIIHSVTTGSSSTVVEVKEEGGTIFETFTLTGSTVTDQGGTIIVNADTSILVRKLEAPAFSVAIPLENDRMDEFNYALIQSYEKLEAGHFISQALSGFNQALIMHNQAMQMPIEDPLGFEEYQNFTQQVKGTIGTNNPVAPLPLNDFLPIRSGALRMLNLQVVDTFGQVKTVQSQNAHPC